MLFRSQLPILNQETRQLLVEQLRGKGIEITRIIDGEEVRFRYRLTEVARAFEEDGIHGFNVVFDNPETNVGFIHCEIDKNNLTSNIESKKYYSNEPAGGKSKYSKKGLMGLAFSFLAEFLRTQNIKLVEGVVGDPPEDYNLASVNSRMNAYDLSAGKTFKDSTKLIKKYDYVDKDQPSPRVQKLFLVTDLQKNLT